MTCGTSVWQMDSAIKMLVATKLGSHFPRRYVQMVGGVVVVVVVVAVVVVVVVVMCFYKSTGLCVFVSDIILTIHHSNIKCQQYIHKHTTRRG